MNPQLALRVAIVGGCALAMFAVIFFRLWFLQVLSGDKYLAQASVNYVRDLTMPAPRGEIVDRFGNLLVDSRPAFQVQLSPPDLPHNPIRRNAEYVRLANVLGMSTTPVKCPVAGQGTRRLAPIPCLVAQQLALLPYANVIIKTDVRPAVDYYLQELQDRFPGVQVPQVFLRSYPLKTVAAQLFGTVGRITAQEVHLPRFRRVSPNAVIGQSGLEYYYDHYLRGVDGSERVRIDSLGKFEGYLPGRTPIAGHTLKLSIDLPLQQAGEQALAEAIAKNPPATGGAFVALNPDDGEVLAMGSSPTFNANIFTKPIPQPEYNARFGASSGYPLFNRAIQSSYPTGSTFKPITATAALTSGAWSLAQTYNDTGQYTNGVGDTRHNAGHASYGVLNIVQAITVSSDDFFYNLGRLTNVDVPNGGPLQDWARKYGIGRSTGIDLGGENAGILPTPSWRAARDQLEKDCELGIGPYKGKGKHAFCGIADGRPWSVGDNENLAVGQGDLEATPLQLAVAYSALANRGRIVTPHVGLEVDQPDGTVLQKINPPAARHISIQAPYLDAIRQGLRDAASQPGGTSADVFRGFPYQVYGKTGTAQRGSLADQSWYVCFVPDSATNKPILVVVTVEQGGFGAQAAAPAARQILSQWFTGKRGPFVVGANKTL